MRSAATNPSTSGVLPMAVDGSGRTGGWCFAFPDICYIPGSPPVPIPVPNIGYLKDAIKCAITVKVENKPMVVEPRRSR